MKQGWNDLFMKSRYIPKVFIFLNSKSHKKGRNGILSFLCRKESGKKGKIKAVCWAVLMHFLDLAGWMRSWCLVLFCEWIVLWITIDSTCIYKAYALLFLMLSACCVFIMHYLDLKVIEQMNFICCREKNMEHSTNIATSCTMDRFFLSEHLFGYQGGLCVVGLCLKFCCFPSSKWECWYLPHLLHRLLKIEGEDVCESALFGKGNPTLWRPKWFWFIKWRGNLELHWVFVVFFFMCLGVLGYRFYFYIKPF